MLEDMDAMWLGRESEGETRLTSFDDQAERSKCYKAVGEQTEAI
jgi:hypothetical protein